MRPLSAEQHENAIGNPHKKQPQPISGPLCLREIKKEEQSWKRQPDEDS